MKKPEERIHLQFELIAIEHWDREYGLKETPGPLDKDAYESRQKRRREIVAKLSDS
jgi:hypothetical protein